MNPDPVQRVRSLCDKLIENRLTREEGQELERLVLSHSAARQEYVKCQHQHASVCWSLAGEAHTLLAHPLDDTPDLIPSPTFSPTPTAASAHDLASDFESVQTARASVERSEPIAFWRYARRVLALAACMALSAWLTWRWTLSARDGTSEGSPTFATLTDVQNAKWGAGRLPTEPGVRLGAGHLRLAQGLARIRFDNGVEVSLEAPADLELIAPDQCQLHHGVLVAQVPEPAIGFIVDTASARLIDQGTEFGVATSVTGETQVQVLEGLVDVEQRPSGSMKRLVAGENSQVSSTQFAVNTTPGYEALRVYTRAEDFAPAFDGITVSTATGQGRDAYVQTEPIDNHSSDVLLLVKNAESDGFRRKTYLGFDLSGIPVERIQDARLVLSMAPTGFGYASFIGASTFSVYGVTDQSLDLWDEALLTWDNAPANRPGGGEVDSDKTIRVGTFEVAEGITSGDFFVESPELVRFLQQDTNGFVTLIVVRDTPERRKGSVVHGFISKRHPTGSAPMLRLVVDPAE